MLKTFYTIFIREASTNINNQTIFFVIIIDEKLMDAKRGGAFFLRGIYNHEGLFSYLLIQ
jgi:hypothetical protein